MRIGGRANSQPHNRWLPFVGSSAVPLLSLSLLPFASSSHPFPRSLPPPSRPFTSFSRPPRRTRSIFSCGMPSTTRPPQAANATHRLPSCAHAQPHTNKCVQRIADASKTGRCEKFAYLCWLVAFVRFSAACRLHACFISQLANEHEQTAHLRQ